MAKGYSTHDRQGNPLSAAQRSCMNYVRRNGNVLQRFSGGFWAMPGPDHPVGTGRNWFRTVTVSSLVKRGQLVWTARARRRDGTMFGTQAATPRAATDTGTDAGPQQKQLEL